MNIVNNHTYGKGSNYPVSPHHICVPVSIQDPDFQRHISWSFVFSELRWELVVLWILVELLIITV